MLYTPFGKLRVLADGRKVEYTAEVHCAGQDVAGCFRILVPAEGVREVRCVLEQGRGGAASTGEDYLALEFVSGRRILTIGAVSDSDAFHTEVCSEGIRYTILSPVAQVAFGVAWAEDYTGDGDVRTWLAADPTLL